MSDRWQRKPFAKQGRIAFILVTILCCAAPVSAEVNRPNFLVILCDDLGYGDLACYGTPTIQTPHLDRLADQGMRLTDCYSAAPVCSASRVGLLTGKTPSRVGVYDWIPAGHVMHMPAHEPTIATVLQGSGYVTCHVGKWHCNGMFNQAEQPQPGDLPHHAAVMTVGLLFFTGPKLI